MGWLENANVRYESQVCRYTVKSHTIWEIAINSYKNEMRFDFQRVISTKQTFFGKKYLT